MNVKDKIKRYISIPDRLYNWFILKYRNVKYEKDLAINGRIYCVSNSYNGIIIGKKVRINSSMKSNPIGGDLRTILFAKGDAKIKIGDGCGISNAALFATEEITLGNNVFVGGGTHIYDTDFHWIDYKRRITEAGGVTKPVVIKDGAFIGAGCIILKGVIIGEKSVIGAGSVVTKDVPDGEVWAGNPAKYIKKI